MVAEKSSVARDIAQEGGERAVGWLLANWYVVTWAVGHLGGLVQPHQMIPAFKAWQAETKPMQPEAGPTALPDCPEEPFRTVKKMLPSLRKLSR